MQRAGSLLLALFAAVVLTGAVYVISDNGGSDEAASTPAAHVTGRAPTPAPTSRRVEPKPATKVVAFLGDDWTAGAGASTPAKRFTSLLAARMHVRGVSFGAAEAGYANPSTGGGSYATEVGAVVAARPDVVVVSGGRNDVTLSVDVVGSDARRLFAALHRRLPEARIVAIAPFWGDSDKPGSLLAVAAAVKAAVTKAGGTYLDLPDPIHDHPAFMADDADPNDRGYAAIAAALEPKLATLVAR